MVLFEKQVHLQKDAGALFDRPLASTSSLVLRIRQLTGSQCDRRERDKEKEKKAQARSHARSRHDRNLRMGEGASFPFYR